MTMYVRALTGRSITISQESINGALAFHLDQRVAYKVLPYWVTTEEAFQRLWASHDVQVATDTGFTSVITSVPSSEIPGGSSGVSGISDVPGLQTALDAKGSKQAIDIRDYVTGSATSTGTPFNLAAVVSDMETTGASCYIPAGFWQPTSFNIPLDNTGVASNVKTIFTYKFIGAGRQSFIRLPPGMTTTDYLFVANSTADFSSYMWHPKAVFEDFCVSGNLTSPNGSFYLGNQRSFTARRVAVTTLYNGFYHTGYSDLVRIEQCYAANQTSGGWFFTGTTSGDGVVVDELFCDSNANIVNGINLSGCRGVSVRSCIGGTHKFNNTSVIFQNFHLEPSYSPSFTTPLVTLKYTQARFTGGYLQGSPTQPIISVNDTGNSTGSNGPATHVVIDEDVRFTQFVDAPTGIYGAGKNVDIDIVAMSQNSDITLHSPRCYLLYNSSALGQGGAGTPQVALKITASGLSNLQTLLTNNPLKQTGEQVIQYDSGTGYKITSPPPNSLSYPTAQAAAAVFLSLSATTSVATKIIPDNSVGTYYYKAWIMDRAGHQGAASSESSVTTTSPNPVVSMYVSTAIDDAVRLRVVRGTASGVYDKYVEVILTKKVQTLFDQGSYFCGQPWQTYSGTPAISTVNETRRGYVLEETGNAVTYASAAPTVGAWLRGDICYNTLPAAGGPSSWVCTTAGTPGTWTEVGSREGSPATVPWPKDLVALWDFTSDISGGTTVTSRVGPTTVLTSVASKTVVKDAADPGPFGPSLVLDGATMFLKAGNLGLLDVSSVGDEVTVIAWTKDLSANHDYGSNGISFRAGSHNDGGTPSRQYGLYFDAIGATGINGKLTPHIGAQDGATPGYIYNYDICATARSINTGTGQNQWHMEAMTFDGAEIKAYIDGITDIYSNVPEHEPDAGQTATPRIVNRNPYPLKKGINRSQTQKRFTIGASSHWDGTTEAGFAYTTGKLGGVAVFNRALSAAEIMKIRLATLLSGEAITMYSFEVYTTGNHFLNMIGWAAGAGTRNAHVGALTSTGPEYAITRPVGGAKSYLTKTSTNIGAAWVPVGGLNSSQLRQVRFKMLSVATTSAAQRVLVKVGSQWWASNTTYATTSAHAGGDTVWTGAETKTHAVNWDIGNWKAVTISDNGGVVTHQNLAMNPALTTNATNWFTAAAAAHATGARTAFGNGFSYRLTWTGTDAPTGGVGGGLNYTGIGAITAGNVYSASMVVQSSRTQNMMLDLIWVDASNAQISTTSGVIVPCPNGTPNTLTVSGTAPALATQLILKAESATGGANWVNGDTLDLTHALVEMEPAPSGYFDGSSTGAVWTGTAGASTSTLSGEAFQNLARNPALTSNSTGWLTSGSSPNATGARTAVGSDFTWRMTWTGTDGAVRNGGLDRSGIDPVVAGNVYSGSLVVTPSKPQKFFAELIWYDSSNNQISVTAGGVVSAGIANPTTIPVSGTAPAGAVKVGIWVTTFGGNWHSGDTLDLSKAIVVAGLPVAYFDGTFSGAVWDVTAGTSTSTQTGVPTGVLSLSGSTNTAWIDNALLTAVGFLSSGGDGSAVRITDLELLPT